MNHPILEEVATLIDRRLEANRKAMSVGGMTARLVRRISRKHEHLVFGVIQSGITAGVSSGVANIRVLADILGLDGCGCAIRRADNSPNGGLNDL